MTSLHFESVLVCSWSAMKSHGLYIGEKQGQILNVFIIDDLKFVSYGCICVFCLCWDTYLLSKHSFHVDLSFGMDVIFLLSQANSKQVWTTLQIPHIQKEQGCHSCIWKDDKILLHPSFKVNPNLHHYKLESKSGPIFKKIGAKICSVVLLIAWYHIKTRSNRKIEFGLKCQKQTELCISGHLWLDADDTAPGLVLSLCVFVYI